MKTAGIIVENYKLAAFKGELDKKGFQYEVEPFKKETSIIKVSLPEVRVPELSALILHVNHFAKRATQN